MKESKEERFKRVAEARVNKIIKMVQLLGNCSNTATYAFDNGQLDKMFATIEGELAKAKQRYTDTEKVNKQRFKLSVDAMTEICNTINEFCVEEYGSEADFSNLEQVGIAYTETDEHLPIQVDIDLVNFTLSKYINNELVVRQEYDSLQDLRDNLDLDFNPLVSFTYEQLAPYVNLTGSSDKLTGYSDLSESDKDDIVASVEDDIRHNNPVNEYEVAQYKAIISERAARNSSDSEGFPSVTLDLPYGTKLRATAIDDENFPAINIDLLENHNHEERRVCFVEYNPERDKGHEISIGVYQHDEDENVFYESYVPKRYTYSIDSSRVMTVFKDGNMLCKISHVSEADKEFIFRDTILRMLDIDSDDESNIGKEV